MGTNQTKREKAGVAAEDLVTALTDFLTELWGKGGRKSHGCGAICA